MQTSIPDEESNDAVRAAQRGRLEGGRAHKNWKTHQNVLSRLSVSVIESIPYGHR
jgi:hypothetical protein